MCVQGALARLAFHRLCVSFEPVHWTFIIISSPPRSIHFNASIHSVEVARKLTAEWEVSLSSKQSSIEVCWLLSYHRQTLLSYQISQTHSYHLPLRESGSFCSVYFGGQEIVVILSVVTSCSWALSLCVIPGIFGCFALFCLTLWWILVSSLRCCWFLLRHRGVVFDQKSLCQSHHGLRWNIGWTSSGWTFRFLVHRGFEWTKQHCATRTIQWNKHFWTGWWCSPTASPLCQKYNILDDRTWQNISACKWRTHHA